MYLSVYCTPYLQVGAPEDSSPLLGEWRRRRVYILLSGCICPHCTLITGLPAVLQASPHLLPLKHSPHSAVEVNACLLSGPSKEGGTARMAKKQKTTGARRMSSSQMQVRTEPLLQVLIDGNPGFGAHAQVSCCLLCH